MQDKSPADTNGTAAPKGPVRLWQYSRTRRLVVVACAVLMVPLALAPLVIAAVMLQVLKDSSPGVVLAVVALLGGISLIELLLTLMVIRAVPITRRWRIELHGGRELRLVVPSI